MIKVYGREAVLILLSGLFGLYLIPVLTGQPSHMILFWVGIFMGLTFAPLYALGTLSGRKMPVKVRNWVGVFLWVLLFLGDFTHTEALVRGGHQLTFAAVYSMLAPGLFGLVLMVLAAIKGEREQRGQAALGVLYAYTFPLAIVMWLMVPMIAGIPIVIHLARHVGALYMALHSLIRLFIPALSEGQDRPLIVRHPIPDRVVGLVESRTHHHALPYATLPDGTRDTRAVSVECPPEEAESLVARIRELLAGQPFRVEMGEQVSPRVVEVVIRPELL